MKQNRHNPRQQCMNSSVWTLQASVARVCCPVFPMFTMYLTAYLLHLTAPRRNAFKPGIIYQFYPGPFFLQPGPRPHPPAHIHPMQVCLLLNELASTCNSTGLAYMPLSCFLPLAVYLSLLWMSTNIHVCTTDTSESYALLALLEKKKTLYCKNILFEHKPCLSFHTL